MKANSKNMRKLGNENSYTPEFFEQLYKKINLKDSYTQYALQKTLILAAQRYMRRYTAYQNEIADHEIKKELKKALNHIDKAANSLIKVYSSGNYGADIVYNLHEIISDKFPSLHSLLKEIKRGEGTPMVICSPVRSLVLLESMAEGINLTLKKDESRKTTPKSMALYDWIMVISAKLEPIIGRKLEQSRYHKDDNGGEYISKKEISDSELLMFIIQPLDPNVTISQIETEIKKTRKERYNAPWNNYFPKL